VAARVRAMLRRTTPAGQRVAAASCRGRMPPLSSRDGSWTFPSAS
jgi:hypothetical protein